MGERLHEIRFPGETQEYRDARDELLKAEVALRREAEAVALPLLVIPAGATRLGVDPV